MEEKDIKIIEEYLEEARDENSFTDCEGLFEDKFFISLDKLLKRYKELELENQALINNQANCPAMNTSGFKCKLKELLEERNK